MAARWLGDLTGTNFGSFKVPCVGNPQLGLMIYTTSALSMLSTSIGNSTPSTPNELYFNVAAFGATDWGMSFGVPISLPVTVGGHTYNPYVQTVGDGSTQHKQASWGAFGFNGAIPSLVGGRSNGAVGSYGTHAGIAEVLFSISAHGADGSASSFQQGCLIEFATAGNWSGSSHPTHMLFYTTPFGSTTPVLGLTLNNDGTIDGTTSTASPGTNSTRLASTAYVDAAVAAAAATIPYGVASGTNTYAATLSPAVSSYVTGQMYSVKFTNGNSGASTLDIGPGAKALQQNGVALSNGAIPASSTVDLIYDGTALQIMGVVQAVPRTIVITIISNGSVIFPGSSGNIPYIAAPATITGWKIVSDDNLAGSIAIDILRSTSLATDPITSMVGGGGTYPNLSAQSSNSGNVSTWASAALAVGDRVKFNVVSATTVVNVALELTLA